MQPLNVVFMGTPEIASDSLQRIIKMQEDGIVNIKSIYTRRPSWNSKKKAYVASSVGLLAEAFNIPLRTPKSLKNNPEENDFLKNLDLDIIIVVAYGLILPGGILGIPKFGSINLHPSLLPDLRGPSPIQYSILKRLKYSGVSIMAMDEGVDTGPVFLQQKIPLGKDQYYNELYKSMSLSGSDLMAETIKSVYRFSFNLSFSSYAQSAFDAEFPLSPGGCYGKMSNLAGGCRNSETGQLGFDDTRIDFSADEPLEIYAKVRAFEFEGGAFFIFRDRKIKLSQAFLEVEISEFKPSGDPAIDGNESLYGYVDYAGNAAMAGGSRQEFKAGTVVSVGGGGLLLSTVRKGVYLRLIKLKPEGRNVMNFHDFVNGYRLKPGDLICQ